MIKDLFQIFLTVFNQNSSHSKMLFFLNSDCDCDERGSKGKACDQTTGKCTCEVFAEGRRCNEIDFDYYD